MKSQKIKIGLDYDGVIAYNPLRLLRAPVSFFKKRFFGVKKLSFYYPRAGLQRWLWKNAFEIFMYPAKGVNTLKGMAVRDDLEFHLVTARYDFMKDSLTKWLDEHNLSSCFKSININEENLQPHVYKENMVKKLGLNVFVEDNLDIVLHLQATTDAKIMWIYNLLDRNKNYAEKYPFLQRALEKLQ